ncbi:putative transcription factor WD40-like family [Rosa chinensis]|uniref:Putative transcription factor WD40-like family n=1 Tax=Rosa chinensis TaxID=74649 RepID=A0A2P6SB29_ROSCH|nr:putative transcription factor WD40-like family [Rosa chinensis]
MPCFPKPGSFTVCEINRDLITSENLSDDGAKETYGKILGMTFSPVPFQSEVGPPPSPDRETAPTKGLLQSLFHPNHVNLLPEVDLQGLSWHPHKHVVAFISGSNQVLVRDYEDSEGKEPCILANESQKDVKVLEWRPNGGRTLSVACSGGICIWAASFPGSVASVRSGASSFLGTLSRGSGIRYTLVDFLRSHNEEQITALSWSPDGRYPNKLTSGFNYVKLKTHCMKMKAFLQLILVFQTCKMFFIPLLRSIVFVFSLIPEIHRNLHAPYHLFFSFPFFF